MWKCMAAEASTQRGVSGKRCSDVLASPSASVPAKRPRSAAVDVKTACDIQRGGSSSTACANSPSKWRGAPSSPIFVAKLCRIGLLSPQLQ